MNASSSPTRSRRPLTVLFLLFFAPLAAAFLLYYGSAWRPVDSTHHGDLIHPARPLPQIALRDDRGNVVPADFLQRSWTLIYIGDGQCDARCRAALADMQRARELLGKDMLRVQSVLLAASRCCDSAFLRATFPKLLIARVDDDSAAQVIAPFPTYDNVPLSMAGRIYIVDPLGNLMMSYAPEASSIGMYDDLKKLLNLSHIG